MTVAKFIVPSSQVANDLSVLARIAAPFAPHAAEPLALAVVVDPGHVMVGSTLIETSTQIVQFTLPATQSRVDRIVINTTTGVASTIAGTEAANPSPPALPAGVIPVARVSLNPTGSVITNEMIVDERDFSRLSSSGGGVTVQRFTASGTYTPTPGTTSVIVDVVGGGGGGGGCAAAASGQGASAGGGSAGAYARARLTDTFSGIAVTVGAAGAGGAAGQNDGSPGAASKFGTSVSAPGGAGGYAGIAFAVPAVVGGALGTSAPTGGNLVSAGGSAGSPGLVFSQYGVIGGNGAPSHFGGAGNGGGNGAGFSGAAPGAGGGGASSVTGNGARVGGAGGAGLVIVYEFDAS